MTVKDATTIKNYCKQHAEILAMLANLTDFVETMPAPSEDGNSIPNIDYGYTGSLNEIHTALTVACEHSNAMSQ